MGEVSTMKRLIRERGLTVQQFATEAGLSKRTIDAYVSGAKQFKKTQLWFALKVADALGIDPHELLEE